MERKQIDKIVSILKESFSGDNTDYMSGVNDGMYTLYRFFFEPYSIPPETREKIDEALKNIKPPKQFGYDGDL